MSLFSALLKVQIKQALRTGRAKGRAWRPVLLLFVAAMVAFPLALGIWAVFNQLYTLLLASEQQAAVLTIAVAGGQLMVFLFGLYYLLSAFYYASDLQLLLPLPLRPRDIVGVKLVVVLAGEYLTVLPLVAPVLVMYGVRGGGGWLYWLLAPAVYLLLPVLPLAVAAIILFPMMRFTAGSRNREVFRVVGSLSAAAVYLVIRFAVLSPQGMPGGREVQPWLQIGHAVSAMSWAAFLPQQWAADALSAQSRGGALAHFLLLATVSGLLLVLAFLLAGRWFVRGVAGGYGARRGRVTREYTPSRHIFTRRRPLAALVFKETKLFFRTPVFVLNGLIGTFVLPVMFGIGFGSRGWAGLPLGGPQARLVIVLIAAGVITVISGLSPVAATAVSREGKMLWISQQLPLSGREQMYAKLIQSLILPLTAALLVGCFLVTLIKLPAWDGALALVLGLAGSVPAAEAGLIIDLLHPNLEWIDPQRAIKGFNGILVMFATVVMLGAAGGAAVLLVVSGVSPAWLPAFLFLFLVSVGLVLFRTLGSLAERRYPRLGT